MPVSNELLAEFAKVVTPKETRAEFTVVTGRAKSYAGKMYVQIDGSDQLTPIASSTVGIKENDWVTVQIKNHSATVTGNATDPSAGTSYADDIKDKVDDVVDQITDFEIVIADKVSTDEFDAQVGRIDKLTADTVNIKEKLTATEADIGKLEADNVTINQKLTAHDAEIQNLDVTKLSVDIADAKFATIENLEATNADIHNLEADYGSFKELTTENFSAVNADIDNLEVTKLNVEDAKLHYANIDFANIGEAAIENFFSKSGMIEDLVVGSGTITGHLVGVTISGDLIEGNTIKADKLVVLGEDGLYYKLNVGGETVAAEQTEYNSINGSIITANTITAEKINVNDLVAFNATIGGFKITDSSLYSGVKESVDNTTRGTYMDDQGQFALGDGSNYLKYYRETVEDGTEIWKLALSASTITLGGSSKPLDQTIEEIQEGLENIDVSVGGRNLVSDSETYSDVKLAGNDFLEARLRLTAYGIESIQDAEEMTISFRYSVPDTSTGVIKLIPRTAAAQDDPEVETQFSTEYDEGLLDPAPQWPSLTTATEGKFSYTTKIAAEHKQYFTDLAVEAAGVVADGIVTLEDIKVEIGSTATDWTPAPEDMATAGDVTQIQDNITDINHQLGATVTIDALNQTISQLVVGEDGQSMMTQTENGFQFDFSSFQGQIQHAIDTATDVAGEYSQVASDIDSLKESTSYINELNSYIAMGETEGTPYIELGQQDGDFKVRITNTEMAFMQGTDKIAYITNNQLYIQSSVVTDEMKIGATDGFIWKRRGNGHMGLRWVNGDYES